MPELLRVSVVAKILNCSKCYVYYLIATERLDAVNFGIRQTRVKRESVYRLISNSSVKVQDVIDDE